MNKRAHQREELLIDLTHLSLGERKEMIALGMLGEDGRIQRGPRLRDQSRNAAVPKRAVHVPGVLNEAYDYTPTPSSFSRGLSLEVNGMKILLISGTASVDEAGETAHAGDFRAQCWRTYRNIAEILKTEKMSWHDVIRTTCYLRDIERDYRDFNEIRTAYFRWLGLDPLPASTGIQTRLCRDDLLVEIEAIAIAPSDPRATK